MESQQTGNGGDDEKNGADRQDIGDHLILGVAGKQAFGEDGIIGESELGGQHQDRPLQMFGREADFLAGAENDNADTDQGSQNAQADLPGDGFFPPQPVDQDDADRKEADDDRGIAGCGQTDAESVENLKKQIAKETDRQHIPPVPPGHRPDAARLDQDHPGCEGGQGNAQNGIDQGRQIRQTDFHHWHIDAPKKGDQEKDTADIFPEKNGLFCHRRLRKQSSE